VGWNAVHLEDAIVAQRWSVDDAVRELRRRMIAHDELVHDEFKKTVANVASRIVGIAGGAAAGMAIAGPLGAAVGALAVEGAKALAAEGVERLVEVGSARFPLFRPGENPNVDPGAALSMAISALYK